MAEARWSGQRAPAPKGVVLLKQNDAVTDRLDRLVELAESARAHWRAGAEISALGDVANLAAVVDDAAGQLERVGTNRWAKGRRMPTELAEAERRAAGLG